MSDAVIIGVLEALEAKYGRNAVEAACHAYKNSGEIHTLTARGVTVLLTGRQYLDVAEIARAGNKIEAIKRLRNYANPHNPSALPLPVGKDMIESIPGVRPSPY